MYPILPFINMTRGWFKVLKIFKSVDLPQPEGPKRANIFPSSNENLNL